MIIEINTDLMDPHIYIDCEIKYHREIRVIHLFARNHCYLKDLVWFMATHYKQSASTTRRKCKAMEELRILRITRSGVTYLSLQSIGLTYALKRRVGSPRALENDIQLEKAHILLRNIKPTYLLPRKDDLRVNHLVENFGIEKKHASNFYRLTEMRHIYLLKLQVQDKVLVLNLIQFDPYSDSMGALYKTNQVLNLVLNTFSLGKDIDINMTLKLIARKRVKEKETILHALEDHFNSDYAALKSYCKKRNPASYFLWRNIRWPHSSIKVEPYH